MVIKVSERAGPPQRVRLFVHRWSSRLHCHECGTTMRADQVKCTTCGGFDERWPLVVNGQAFK